MEAIPLRKKRGDASRFDVGEALREVAEPRMTGSDGAARVGAAIRARFEALGYDVRDTRFTFNPWPGRFGITAVGALFTLVMIITTGMLYADRPYGAIAVLLVLLVVVGLFAGFVSSVIDRLRIGVTEGVNMFASVPGHRPRYIIMAHRDSKSQPVSLAFRGPAIAFGVLSWIALLIATALHTARPLPTVLVLLLGAVGVMSGIVLILCWVDNRSPGALDNASGVVAALGVAARERAAGDVAFLITDAEELGLAGARVAAATLPPVFGVINIDGLDDHGPFYVLERFGVLRKRGLAPHLAAALLEEAADRNEPADRRDLPFGIPVDHIPIVKAGTPALTLMRGSFRSLQRVHMPKDSLEHLSGDGVKRAIDIIAGALTRLRQQARFLER